jgi:signal transduction histidine kinase
MNAGSLRLRLLAGAGVFILTAVVLSAAGLTFLFERHVQRWIDAELTVHMDQVIAGLELDSEKRLVVRKPPSDPRFERALSGLYWEVAVEPAGPTLRSRSLWDYEIALPKEATVNDVMHRYMAAGPGNSQVYLLQRRIELPARLGGQTARVAIALDNRELRAAVRRFATALLPFLALIGGLLTLAAWAQVSVGLRPLASVRASLAAIGSGSLRRLGSGFPSEVQPLAREFDTLLDERDAQIAKARAGAADLAHGLKTPLQVLAGEAERLKRQGAGDSAAVILDIASVMQRHVERQLARARIGKDALATSDVRQVAESVVRVVERSPDGQRLVWSVTGAVGLEARIDTADLAEALGNLVENAARYAASRVTISARRQGRFVDIAVTDDGPGIPEGMRDEALRRGGRLDTRPSGAVPADGGADEAPLDPGRAEVRHKGYGLGLAIVADIADNWGARIDLETIPPTDGGAGEFRISLLIPAAGPPAPV